MIDKIIAFSIKQKFIIFLFVLTIIAAGFYSLKTINLGSVPDITNNQVQIITVAPNLATSDIEQFITYPVEQSMGFLQGVEEIRSISRFGLSVVTVVFNESMGTYLPRQLIQEKLKEVQDQIPGNIGSPEMGPVSTGLGEIYQYSLRVDSGNYSLTDLRTIQDWIIKRQLTMLEGVVEVNSFGGFVKQYEVVVSPEKLKSFGITLPEIASALSDNNINAGGSYIVKNKMANFIRGEGLIRSLNDIKNIAVKTINGVPLTIADIADEVTYGTQVRYGAFTQDGKEQVGGMVLMLKGANPNKVITAVKERIASIQESLPPGITIAPYHDRSELIQRTTSTLSKNLIEGALIVVFVLVILLGSLRGGLVTASVIPLALLFAFILMKIFDVWANLMSLGAIDFGIIVDGAVIIVEGTVHNLYKRIKQSQTKIDATEMDDIVYHSASSMMNSAFFGQLIILIVFAPILFLEGVEGKMFHPMAYTFGFAVIGAILLCLTYVPMITSLSLKPHRKNTLMKQLETKLEHFSNRLITQLNRVYLPIIQKALSHTKLVIISALLLLSAAVYLFLNMGGEFVPQLDEGDLALQLQIKPGSSLEEMIQASEKTEKILLENFPEVITTGARIGVADIPTDPMPMDVADMFMVLEKDKSKWVTAETKEELIEKINEKLSEELLGVNFVFSQPVQLRFNELLSGVREDVAIKIFGEDLTTLNELSGKIAALVTQINGVADVSPERISGLPQITIRFNRKKMARYGVSVGQVVEYINTAFAGHVAGVVFEGEKRFDLVVRFGKDKRQDISNVKNMFVSLNDGTQIPLNQLADIDFIDGPMQISRENTFRRTYVGINVRNRDVESVITDIQQLLKNKLDIPPGYYLTYGGEFENLQRAKQRLSIVVPIALFLIFVMLFFALNSLKQSVMIFLAIPLAAIGGVLFLYARQMPFSISAGVGFIVLFGVAILNGLVLINRFNELKAQGMELYERIITGTQERLRPILLTAVSAIMGFMPMAFSASSGAEVQRPLATVVIGGLISATLLTLVVIPVLYYLLEKKSGNTTAPLKASVATLLIFLSIGSVAQTEITSVDTALELAKKQNKNVLAAAKNIAYYEKLKHTAFSLPKTEIAIEYGQYNSFYNDMAVTITQPLDFPTTYFHQKQLLTKQKELADVDAKIVWLQLNKEITQTWNRLALLHKKLALMQKVDTMYQNLYLFAQKRAESGEISQLEAMNFMSKSMEINNNVAQLKYDINAVETQLNILVGDSAKYHFVPTSFSKTNQEALQQAQENNTHPELVFLQKQVETIMVQKKVEKGRFLPDFSIGYFNLSMIGNDLANGGIATSSNRFTGIAASVSIPIFFRSYTAKIKSYNILQEQSEMKYQYAQALLNSQINRQVKMLEKYKSTLAFYEESALKTADEIIKTIALKYRNGTIDYIEFAQNYYQAITINLNYITAQYGYFNTLEELNYLLSK